MSVRDVLASHTSRELSEWMAYASLNPFGLIRRDTAAQLWMFAAANHDSEKGEPKSFGYFIGDEAPERALTPEEAVAYMQSIFAPPAPSEGT